MRVVESLALGGRRQLLLVMCDEQEYLVGTGAESVETIVFRQTGAEPGVSHTGSAQSNAGQNNTLQTSGTGASAGQKAVAKPGTGAPGGRPALGGRPWLLPTTRGPIAALRIGDADSNKALELRQ